MRVLGKTPFSVGVFHWRFDPRKDSAVVAVKGSFRLRHGEAAEPLPEPVPLQGDLFEGEPPELGRCVYPSDLVPRKPCADLVLLGRAHSSEGRPQVTARFAVGDSALSLRVPTGDDAPPVTGFGPRSPVGSERMAQWPAVTPEWLESWPWVPADLDYGYFNAAQPALQAPRYLRGDEVVQFDYLHPTHPRFKATLPGLRVRCFVLQKEAAEERFREVSLELDTLFVDMTQELLVLVWRGDLPAQSLDLEEIEEVFLSCEPLSDPRMPIEQARQLFEIHRSEANGATRAESPRLAGANDNEAPPVPPARPKPPPPPAPAQVAGPLPPALRQQLEKMGTPLPVLAAIEDGDLAKARSLLKTTSGLSEERLSQMQAEALEKLEKSKDTSRVVPPPPSEARPRPSQPTPPADWSRERVQAALASGVSLAGADLAELDLSGLDLSAADLSGCVLTRAKLDGAKLDGAKLDGATLSGASARSASFAGATLVEADLTRLSAPLASFAGATLKGALFDDAALVGAKLRACQAEAASFKRADLSDSDLEEAQLQGALLIEATLHRATLRAAKLDRAVIESSRGEDVDLRGASLIGLRAGEGSVLVRLKAGAVKAAGSGWMGARLAGADLTRADLTGADLSRTDLSEARLAGAALEGADLARAKLSSANLSGSNLRGAQLDHSDLRRADLRDASLYQANLFQAELAGANLEGAFTAGTLLASPVRGWARG